MNKKFAYKDGETSILPDEVLIPQLEKVYSQAIDHSIKIVEKNLGVMYPHATQKIIAELEKLKSK